MVNVKTEGPHGVPNPIHIRNHGDALPAKDVLHPDFEIVPDGPRDGR